MNYLFDIETDGIKATKIHCLSYCGDDKKRISLTSYSDIKDFVLQDNITLIGHNIVRYDIPVLNRILKIDIKANLVDTLPLSWYLYPERKLHGLEVWGNEFGVQKPKINDWANLSVEDYVHRCEEDVEINRILWNKQREYLLHLYGSEKEYNKLIRYFSFKMDCVREQEEEGIRLDVEKCQTTLDKFITEKNAKMVELRASMPKQAIKKVKEYNGVVDADGNFSKPGELFYASIEPIKKVEKIEKVVGYKPPNPNSTMQIKDWLYSLGWVPEHIKYVRNKKTGETKQIPQVGSKEGGGEICNSIKKLFTKEPKLEMLNGLSVLSHRIGLLKGFLNDQEDGILYPTTMGLTNTFRLQHAVIVNLPGGDKKYAEEVRSCLIANEGQILCGSDLSNIEDRTKRHYIYKYDPKYVEEMSVPGYDAHLVLGIKANLVTKEEAEFFKSFDKDNASKEDKAKYFDIKAKRHKSKTTNFSATYKVGAEKLARELSIKLKEAKNLLKGYWELNKAILQVEDSLEIKTIGGAKWLKNPVSKFWYSLRNDKDKFSTLNQGTAVYCFDIWIYYVRKLGINISLQYHDEILFNLLPAEQEIVKTKIQKAMNFTNKKLNLNVELGCSADFGDSYWSVH